MAGNIAGAQRREALKLKYRARLPRFTPTAIFSQYATVEIPASPTGIPTNSIETRPVTAPSTTSATSTGNEDNEPVTTSSRPPVLRPTTTTLRTSSSSLPSSSRSLTSSMVHSTPVYSVTPSSTSSTASSSSTTIAAEANGAVSHSRGVEIIGIIASVFVGSMMLISAFAFYWRRRNMKARAKRTSRFRSSLMVSDQDTATVPQLHRPDLP
ncbi:hypothetical protein PM082_019431 [Marasmius tenuissimus]|nr:hypothetical protein PM082_019431 [Marasmius tenuissimus]